MKKLFAKLKNDQHAIVFDDMDVDGLSEIYKKPNVTAAIPFEVDTRTLTEGEWYFIVPTEEQKIEMIENYQSESGGMVLERIVEDEIPEITVLYLVDGEEKLFTKVTSRHVVESKKFVTWGKGPELFEQKQSVWLSGEVDAYWTGTRLYFKKFTYVQSLFPGIKKVYKDMTEKETNDFLSSVLFELKDEMSSEFIGLRTRKRIANLVAAKLIDLQDQAVTSKYLEYAKDYDLDLEIEGGKIALIDNSDINKVLNLFGESFYTTPITGEKREIQRSSKIAPAKRKRAK